MRIFIHRGQSTFGPYRLEDVLHELSNGSLKPTDMATYDGGGNRFVPLAIVPGVAGTTSTQPVAPHPRGRLGCGGWVALIFLIALVTGIVGSLLTDDKEAATREQTSHRRAPHEFGWAMGRQLLRSATTDSGSGGMVIFAQGCRAENPTVKTYTNAEYQQFLNGLIDAYIEWRRNGYVVPDTEIKDRAPAPAPTAAASVAPRYARPRPPYPNEARLAHTTGTGVCHVVFGADGRVSSAEMTRSTGSSVLDLSTMDFVSDNWTGQPGTKDNFTFVYNLP